MIVGKIKKVNTYEASRTTDGTRKHSKSACYYKNDCLSSEASLSLIQFFEQACAATHLHNEGRKNLKGKKKNVILAGNFPEANFCGILSIFK